MFTNRDLALIAAFAGLIVGYGVPSSLTLRALTRSYDIFFLIACLFTILTVEIRKLWAATLLGTISGLVFLLALLVVPAAFPPHIAASLIANGLAFDLYLKLGRIDLNPVSRNGLVGAASIGNLAMAAVALGILQALGVPFPLFVWPLGLIGDSLLGAAGALFGLSVIRRIQRPVIGLR